MSQPQPQFSDGPPVPLMTEGTIDAAMLRQLAADLAKAADVLFVREKTGAFAGDATLTVEAGIDRLIGGKCRAIQVRYRYDGFEWTDTIMAIGKTFRVVRCRHDA